MKVVCPHLKYPIRFQGKNDLTWIIIGVELLLSICIISQYIGLSRTSLAPEASFSQKKRGSLCLGCPDATGKILLQLDYIQPSINAKINIISTKPSKPLPE